MLGGTSEALELSGDDANEMRACQLDEARGHDRTKRHNFPAKKQGAGGKYTWGGLLDVTDFAPVGHVEANVRVSSSSSSAAIPGEAVARSVLSRRTAEMRQLPTQITRSSRDNQHLYQSVSGYLFMQDASQFPALPLRPISAAVAEDAWVVLPSTPRPHSPASSNSYHSSVASNSYGSVASSVGVSRAVSALSAWGSVLSTAPPASRRGSANFPPSSPVSFTLPSPAMSLSTSPRSWMPAGFPMAVSPPTSPEPFPAAAFGTLTAPSQ